MEFKKKRRGKRLGNLYPRWHHGSWWAYDRFHDSDTGPYSTKEQAQEWIDSIKSVKGGFESE